MDTAIRPRRLRMDNRTRELVRETRIGKTSLIYPIFVEEGKGILTEIGAMPGRNVIVPIPLHTDWKRLPKQGSRI